MLWIGIGLGVGAAAAWGAADFCAKKAAIEFGCGATLFGMNAVGVLLLAAATVPGWVAPLSAASLSWLGLALANTAGGLLFYFALQHGRLSLVSPLTAAYPLVAVALAALLAHERLSAVLCLAVAAALTGTLLASLGSADQPTARGEATGRGERGPQSGAPQLLGYGDGEAALGPAPILANREPVALLAAVGSAIMFGCVFFGLAVKAPGSGAASPVFLLRLVGALCLGLPYLMKLSWPSSLFRSRWVWLTGGLDSLAYLLYIACARRLPVAVASALGGLFTVFTLFLALVFLRERLGRRQWLGVAMVVAALAAMAWG